MYNKDHILTHINKDIVYGKFNNLEPIFYIRKLLTMIFIKLNYDGHPLIEIIVDYLLLTSESLNEILYEKTINNSYNISITLLDYTVMTNDIKITKLLLQQDRIDINKSSINEGPSNIHTPLYFACEYNYLSLVKILLKEPKINVNSIHQIDGTPLMIACKFNNIEIVKELLDHKDININLILNNNMNLSAFIAATMSNNLEILKFLVDKGADYNHCLTLGNTVLICYIKIFTKNGMKKHKINYEIIKYFIKLGIDVNKKSVMKTSLYYAIRLKDIKIIELLLESKADFNYEFEYKNGQIMTLLDYISYKYMKYKTKNPCLENYYSKIRSLFEYHVNYPPLTLEL